MKKYNNNKFKGGGLPKRSDAATIFTQSLASTFPLNLPIINWFVNGPLFVWLLIKGQNSKAGEVAGDMVGSTLPIVGMLPQFISQYLSRG